MKHSSLNLALGIVGSPRRGGNTEILVDEILAGVEEGGASVKKVILSDLTISPCRACDGCRKTHRCAQDDDMGDLLLEMQRSQVWVLGTPIYWWGPTAQFKAFVDRWYGANSAVFNHKRAILAIAMGGESSSYARYAVGMLTSALEYLNIGIVATVLATGVADLGAVRSRREVLTEARQAGMKAAKDLV